MWVNFIAVALLTLHLSAAFPDIYEIVPGTVGAVGNDTDTENGVGSDAGTDSDLTSDSGDVADTGDNNSNDSSGQGSDEDEDDDDGLVR